MIGAAVGSAIAMTLGTGNPAPWGGWIVAFVSQKPLIYLLASLIGVVVTASMVILLKPTIKKTAPVEKESDDDFDIGDLKVL
ncbi:hypothetical protein [Lacticaseibacillus manihotivorans]|jgi:fructose-specific PTS system IIC-like component|uniref:Uncharacterized protein n=2 Tax=Lacticaseibacillus manihotivorans TaxID=88233 RepID=A0A0R1RAZ1_9LACO|nr:hypothetical protein [Lacticaseibacillus manihotivorans]KRL54119.1 hypothetical protein FD01_GL002972 [Lacticaseibacillus manihotivorans DSM 13343 = JCM 12514]QFQ90138.1 hypothetical protein LM010_01205 [Lacticaseibacillus manihotivorans]